MPVLELPELPAETSAGPVDDASLVDEMPLVDSGTLVTGGPDENPGGPAVPPHAARTRAARLPTRPMITPHEVHWLPRWGWVAMALCQVALSP